MCEARRLVLQCIGVCHLQVTAAHSKRDTSKACPGRSTHLQCSSIKLSDAPEVASSTGEVSRHRCMHCGAAAAGLFQFQARGAWQVQARDASTGCWHRHALHMHMLPTLVLWSWHLSRALVSMGAIWW